MIGILSAGRILNKNILGDKYSQGISIPINYDNAYNRRAGFVLPHNIIIRICNP